MFGASRMIALLLAFTMGFGLAAGIFIGVPAAILASYTLRDLENTNLVSIPDEKFIEPDAPVDILDLNAIELYNEYQELIALGDSLTLSVAKERYGIIFNEKLDKLLSDKARNTPLKQLFSMEGIHLVLETVYIGNIEGYKCLNPDGTEGDPQDENTYWFNPDTNHTRSGIEEIIADFTLDDFISGNINTDTLLHGGIVLADILGYSYNEEKAYWVDSSGNKVVGILSVFADCTLDNVDEKINDAKIGDLLSYVLGEDGNWYSENESGELTAVHSFMNAVAKESIGTLGGLFERITVGDIIPEDQRQGGLISIVPADTTIDQIGNAVNNSVSNTPLQFFINQNLVDFSEIDDKLDMISELRNDYVFIEKVEEGEEGYSDFARLSSYYSVEDADGNAAWSEVYDEESNLIGYSVEIWRTKLLSQSFAYMLSIVDPSLTSE